MKNKNRKQILSSNTFLILLAIAILTTAITKTSTAKSLYVIADIKGASEDRTLPVQAYDIGIDGTLTFQAQHDIPHSMLGAVGMAIDSDYGYIFITYEASDDIQLIEATTMADAGKTRAPDATNLAGIVYDHEKHLVYCVDRRTNNLYVYNWWPDSATLTHAPGSPFVLENATAYGIALDEIDDRLYVANATNTVNVYSTSDWQLIETITLSRIAISIAVDVTNGFVYTGGGFAENMFLTQYHLATQTEAEVQVEPDAGVMGLGVDHDTGLVYMSTGMNTVSGGDNLLVYDASLNQIDIITAIGNPTGLTIPGKDIGYNPLNLNKQVLRGAGTSPDFDDMKTVGAGDRYTYDISFDNNNDYSVTDVTIVDKLPEEVTFVSASDDGVNGFYDYDEITKTHTYTWSYAELPPKTSTLLEITVQVKPNIDPGRIITNSVTINSNQTPPTTTSVDVMTTSNTLNLTKSIVGDIEGEVIKVDPNDTITYMIDFDNKGNDFPVTNVIIDDALPEDVTFVSADNGKASGKYDEKSRTYTWILDSLQTKETVHLELTVFVNPDVELDTTITNIVTVYSDQTPQSSASVDALTYYKPLNITNKALDEEGNEIEWVDPNDTFIYQICFDNNDNTTMVTGVKVVDTLPKDVTFKDVIFVGEKSKTDGKYNKDDRTYKWSYDFLDPGSATCVKLVVDVNENVLPGTLITNSVTIESNETSPQTVDANIYVGEPGPVLIEVDDLSITPDVLKRNGTSRNIMAEVELPPGITKDDIDTGYRPKLYYLNSNNKLSYITRGSHSISGTSSRPKVIALFSRSKLMDKVHGYGEVTLRVKGKLSDEGPSERYYYGYATVHITRFAGY